MNAKDKEMRLKFKKMADDLRKAESWCDLDGVLNRIKTMQNLYEMGYRRQSEWISVEDRLPDVCGMDVLMVAVNCYGQTNIVKGFTDYQCPINFLTNEKQYENIWRAWEVTHWIPLPEPPKMKGA